MAYIGTTVSNKKSKSFLQIKERIKMPKRRIYHNRKHTWADYASKRRFEKGAIFIR